MRGLLLNLQPRWILIQMKIAVLKNIMTEEKRGLGMRKVKTEAGWTTMSVLNLHVPGREDWLWRRLHWTPRDLFDLICGCIEQELLAQCVCQLRCCLNPPNRMRCAGVKNMIGIYQVMLHGGN
jgi:hypothetical protein